MLYLYAISEAPKTAASPIASEGIDGSALVEAIRCEGYLCWISRVSKDEFADHLNERMQDLEWLASAGLRHQRVVGEISRQLTVLPARFGTAFLTDDSLARHVKARKAALCEAFKRVADADEWGVKVFAVAKPRTSAMVAAVSGSDYLKKKAQMLHPPANKKFDEQVREFADALAKLAVESTAGGKASAGQPGLLWHGSLLVRRKDQKKLQSALKKYTNKWEGIRRIEWSGPWPPYSFVEDHVR